MKLGESIVFERPVNFTGIEIIRGQNVSRPMRMFHEHYCLCRVHEAHGGHNVWTYRGRVMEAGQGSVMMMQPGEMHATRKITAPVDFSVLQLTPSLVREACLEIGGNGRFPSLREAQTDSPILFSFLGAYLDSLERTCTLLEKQDFFIRFLRRFLQDYAETPPPSGPDTASGAKGVQWAEELLRERWAENISLDDLSKAAGLSRFHLLHSFTRRMGIPPHAYQVQLRLSHARRLLGLGKSVAETALETGFADQSHLTRHFKRQWGITPSRYLKS